MIKPVRQVMTALLSAIGLTTAGAASANEADVINADPGSLSSDEWRQLDPENVLVFTIGDAGGRERGEVLIEVAPFAAPNHVERIKTLARSGKYDGTVFHRVISDFMAQGGDITQINPEGSGLPNLQPEFSFMRNPEGLPLNSPEKPEYATIGLIDGFPVISTSPLLLGLTGETEVESWISHCKGTTSMARTDDPASANSQFFLMRETRQHLDYTAGKYTGWGRIVAGQDVVDAIRPGPENRNGSVSTPDVLVSATVLADQPEATRPTLYVERTDSPAFAAKLAEAQDVRNVCDLPTPGTRIVLAEIEG